MESVVPDGGWKILKLHYKSMSCRGKIELTRVLPLSNWTINSRGASWSWVHDPFEVSVGPDTVVALSEREKHDSIMTRRATRRRPVEAGRVRLGELRLEEGLDANPGLRKREALDSEKPSVLAVRSKDNVESLLVVLVVGVNAAAAVGCHSAT